MRVDNRERIVRRSLRAQLLGSKILGHDALKASTRRLQARSAYEMRVENRANVAYAAAWAV